MVVPEFSNLESMLRDGPAPTPRRAELHRLAAELRVLIDALVTTEAPADALSRAAASLSEVVGALKVFGSSPPWSGFAEAANAGEAMRGTGGSIEFFDHSPIIGVGNAIAPPVRAWIDGDVVRAEVNFGAAYEGPPGNVHGGWIAATFDEVLGMTQSLSGAPGMTAKLVVNYRRPTPLRSLIRYEGRIDRVEGRKIFTVGRAFNDVGDLLDEAEALFISIDFSKLMAAAAAAAVRRAADGSTDDGGFGSVDSAAESSGAGSADGGAA